MKIFFSIIAFMLIVTQVQAADIQPMNSSLEQARIDCLKENKKLKDQALKDCMNKKRLSNKDLVEAAHAKEGARNH